ncbi:MAG: hypothetical protein H6550_08070 [Chitinophagales bacterium]|nr:hypothetical protein [Chitinophagales bacterium]
MEQRNKFRIALVLITLICYIDYQFFGEGYAVREIAPYIRQAGHLVILVAVFPIGYWAWNKHPMQWLKKIWVWSYSAVICFILIIGLLKNMTSLMGAEFLDWVTTVRYLFSSPLPLILIYMLSLIAQKGR